MKNLNEFELDLSDRKLTDQELVDLLKDKPHLKGLDVSSNSTLTSLDPVSKLMRLESLYIGDTSIVDLSPLTNLCNLKFFNADDTQVSDISPLIKSTRLQTLILTSTKDDNRVLELVNNFPELTELSLSDSLVKGDISNLKCCTNLESLALGDMETTGFSLSELTALQKLSFLSVSPEDEGIKRRMTQKIFGLQKREENAELSNILYYIQDALKRLKHLHVDEDHIDGIFRENALTDLNSILDQILELKSKLQNSRDNVQKLNK